ncbi:MAG: hypothetical protein ACREPT_09100 [Rudaea sp.]
MKSILLTTAICLTIAAVSASAGETRSLSPVTVRANPHDASASVPAANGKEVTECTPPNAAAACSAFHSEIRRNFSTREIGMLFGAASAYPEYAASYSKVSERYQTFLRDYEQRQSAQTVAAK